MRDKMSARRILMSSSTACEKEELLLMIPHQARLSAKRKIKTAARRSQTVAAPLPPAWFLTDPVRTPDPLKIMMHLPRGWGVVYRHFGAEDRMKVASDMQKVARSQGLFLSASFDETLLSLRLDGVHWPRWMLPKRRSVPGMGLQSSSAHSHRGVTRAERSGMDVCFVSSVFPATAYSAESHGRSAFSESIKEHSDSAHRFRRRHSRHGVLHCELRCFCEHWRSSGFVVARSEV